jgi:hypothetical protein
MTADTTVLNALIGAAMPLLIAVVNQSHWSPKVKALVAVLVCATAATITEWVRGDVDWADWRGTALVIAGAALVSYNVWWQPSTIAPTVEAVTTITGPDV